MAAADRGFAVLAASVAVLFVVSASFAALALALRLRNDRAERRQQMLTDRWEPVMLEVLAGAAPAGRITALVAERDRSAFLTFLVGYARRLRGEERATIRGMAMPLLPSLIRTLGRGSQEARGLAVHRLAEIGLPEHAGSVAEALRDRSPEVAVIAARGLFREGLEPYFPAVLAELPRFTRLSRPSLAGLLANGGPGAAPLLRAMLGDPAQSAQIRAVVADALTLLNDLDAVPLASALLEAGGDRELISACLRLVRQLGHRDHVAAVRPLVESADPLVRAAAAGALGALGGPAEVPLLQEALDDEHYWVSLQAARGLMALGDVETLRRLAASTGSWAVLARQVLAE
jgi:HEAT repeat protein